ncbi:MAG: SpoIIE family protein phosphatase, partial [Clostridia bacterium]|nr:SpoIIE family protein phosphatase [Clostridia bacterium]
AVSRLLLDVGEEIDTNVRFDIARENKIISRLLNLNIQCKEVLLYTEKNEDVSAVLVVKSEHSYNPLIEKIVSEALKIPMNITKIMPLDESGFNSVQLRKKNKFDCIFGLASCNKAGNEESGDCHSIIRLGGNKFLLALCDGMGAGKSAHKMSAMTLGLIENFYKVGFDNDVILESVNKLLTINNQENYSTLDVCLIDLEKEILDFIKVGSPFALIRRENLIETVEGGALPIGALESVNPSTFKTTISTKDIIIMATDGVVDVFETSENMIEFISRLATNNPQTIADAILNEALHLSNNSAKDDMTVLVARTYLK